MGKTNRFVITGLPRSRTAWFSAYLTTGDCICYHEAAAHGDDMDADYAHVGTGESGYVLLPDWVRSLGTHKLVVIHRDPDEVDKSLSALKDDTVKDKGWLLTAMATQLRALRGLHIEYEAINDSLPEIHEYLGLPYSQERADLFTNLNIQSQDWR